MLQEVHSSQTYISRVKIFADFMDFENHENFNLEIFCPIVIQ